VPSGAPGSPASPPGAPPQPAKQRESLLLRLGDIPLRAVYTVAALIATIAAVVLVFTLFSEDTPQDGTVTRARAAEGSPTAEASASPAPSATLQLSAPPRSMALPRLPGKAATVTGLVVDDGSGLVYARLGKPWTKTSVKPFTAAQRAGSAARAPRALIASGPLPGKVPANLKSDAQYRALAAQAAHWTLRYQPKATKVTWTASQAFSGGRGWVLGYRVTYQVNGKSRTCEAVVVVADTGKKKPGLLFATVPDTRKSQYRDLNTLVSSLRLPG